MSIFKDLTGLQVGDLTVLEFAYKKPRTDKNGGYTYYWWCLCKCGKLIAVRSTDLTRKDNRRRRSCNECKAKKTKEFHRKRAEKPPSLDVGRKGANPFLAIFF